MSTMPEAPADQQVAHLERLGQELRRRRLRVRLTDSLGRPPRLHIMNPEMSSLTEDVRVELTVDGWWFVWSWAERICPAEDVTDAADLVVRVLRV